MGKRKSSTKPPPKKVRHDLLSRHTPYRPRRSPARLGGSLTPSPLSQTPKKPTKKQNKQAAPKLDTSFNCPFCNGARTVTCAIDLEHGLATARCGACGEAYQTQADHLTEPVDVMSDWLDACEADGGR